MRYTALLIASLAVLAFVVWNSLPESTQTEFLRSAHIGRPERPPLVENTGWLFLGYFHAGPDSAFDAEGPSFKFEKRLRHTGPYIPSKGDVIRLTKTHRVMMTRTFGQWYPMDQVCGDYDAFDQHSYDTGVRLPRGTEVVVRDVGEECQDYSKPGDWAALWVRIQYPR